MDRLLSLIELVKANPALVALIGGAVTPLIVSVLQQPQLTKMQRTLVSVAASVVLGGAAALSTGMFDSATDLATIIVVLYTASETFYQKLWKKIGVTQSIEAATSPKPAPAPEPVVEGEPVYERE